MTDASEISGETPNELSAGVSLDPFGYWPETASAITGLGGTQAGDNPDYVFHSPYIGVSEGPAFFRLEFTGLQAPEGIIALSVNELPDGDHGHARQTSVKSVPLRQIMRAKGAASIEFYAEPSRRYSFLAALEHAGIREGLRASALTAYAISGDRALAMLTDVAGPDGKPASGSFRGTALLTSLAVPDLAHPACQPFTEGQLASDFYRGLSAELQPFARDNTPGWSDAFVLQSLRHFKLAAPGARALSLGDSGGALARYLAAQGWGVTLTGQQTGELPPNVEHRGFTELSLNADEWGFDAVWTGNLVALAGDVSGAAAFAIEAMDMVKSGGIAVFVMPYIGEASPASDPALPADNFTRGDVERLAMKLISRGQNVAQLRHDRSARRGRKGLFRSAAGAEPTQYGMIVQQGD